MHKSQSKSRCLIETAKFDNMQSKTDNLQIIHPASLNILPSRKIERIQERALRAVFNSHSESYENLLARAELPSLLNRRLQGIAILMYKVKYGLAPSIVNEPLKRKSTTYSLRNSDFDIPTLTLLTMESILLDIKDLIYGRN